MDKLIKIFFFGGSKCIDLFLNKVYKYRYFAIGVS